MNTVLCAYPWRKLLLLTVALYLLNLITGWIFEPGMSVPGASALELAAFRILEALLQSVVILELIRRSVWRGWPLAWAVFLVHFVVVTALSWVEALAFLDLTLHKITTLHVHLGLVRGLVTAAALGWLSTAMAGPSRPAGASRPAAAGLPGGVGGWSGRLAGVSVLYVFIYFLFGALVAVPLAGPAFREFYADLQPSAWMPLLAAARGVVWGLVAVLIVRMVDLERGRAALLVGLAFSLLMGALLVSPNPIIPDRMRWSHFVEVSTENFIFGWLTVRLLTRRVRGGAPEPAAG